MEKEKICNWPVKYSLPPFVIGILFLLLSLFLLDSIYQNPSLADEFSGKHLTGYAGSRDYVGNL